MRRFIFSCFFLIFVQSLTALNNKKSKNAEFYSHVFKPVKFLEPSLHSIDGRLLSDMSLENENYEHNQKIIMGSIDKSVITPALSVKNENNINSKTITQVLDGNLQKDDSNDIQKFKDSFLEKHENILKATKGPLLSANLDESDEESINRPMKKTHQPYIYGSFLEVAKKDDSDDDTDKDSEKEAEEEKKKKEEEAKKAEEEKQRAIRQAYEDFQAYKKFIVQTNQKLIQFLNEVVLLEQQTEKNVDITLKNSLLRLKGVVESLYKPINDTIAKEYQQLRAYIRNATEEIKQELEEVLLKSNASLCETKELKTLFLEFTKEDDQTKIERLLVQIDELQAKLPPMKSICNHYLDCGTCTANPMCGWCVTKDKCIDGDEVGPLDQVCSFYNYRVCTGFECGNNKDCTSCLGNPSCGWCEDPIAGSDICLERPANYTSCNSPNLWYHSLGSQNVCKKAEATTPEDIQKLERKGKWEAEKKDRQNELSQKEALVTEEDKKIEEQQEQLIKWKQEVEKLRKEIQDLDIKITALEEEMKHCKRVWELYEHGGVQESAKNPDIKK